MMTQTLAQFLRALAIASLLGLGMGGTLTGCASDGPFEEAGEEVDEAVDEVEDELD